MTEDPVQPPAVGALLDRLFRRQAGQMIATLTRAFGVEHLDMVEDVVQESMVEALRRWPYTGVPERPTAWLVRVARNRAIDRVRRTRNWQDKVPLIEAAFTTLNAADPLDPAPDANLADDELQMVFMCCHPALSRDQQVALTLKTVGGFSSDELSRAFLVSRPTLQQRLVRARRRLRDVDAPFELPGPDALPHRLGSVLETLYLMFNEGYAAGEGAELVRRDLTGEAVRLARLLVSQAATALPESYALLSLFQFHAAREDARLDAAGSLVLLEHQDRAAWDQTRIAEATGYLRMAGSGPRLTRFHLEAEIAAHHAHATSWSDTDWRAIRECYDLLMTVHPSPVAGVARAVAVAEEQGPEEGVAALDAIEGARVLASYLPWHAARGELLARCGRTGEAARAFKAALALGASSPLRSHLEARLRSLSPPDPA